METIHLPPPLSLSLDRFNLNGTFVTLKFHTNMCVYDLAELIILFSAQSTAIRFTINGIYGHVIIRTTEFHENITILCLI